MKIQVEQVVSFETAKLAEEKGFVDIIGTFRGKSYYTHKGELNGNIIDSTKEYSELRKSGMSAVDVNKNNKFNPISAPTQSLLQKWLREQHNLQVYAYSSTKHTDVEYCDYVVYVNGMALNDARDEEYDKYEDALEFGLQEALKLIK